MQNVSTRQLLEIWLNVSYGANVYEVLYNDTWSILHRVNDLHSAFLDDNIDGILTTIWWLNANTILNYIDYELISNNPKVLCGYSDITCLLNAIYAKTWLVTYNWPHFSTFWIEQWNEYTINNFRKCLFDESWFFILPSDEWSNDERYLDQRNRNFIKNKWFISLQAWETEWELIWWNLNTLNLLQGTDYFPLADDWCILFIEDVWYNAELAWLDRNIESILQVKWLEIKWLLIWRFPNENLDLKLLKKILLSKKSLLTYP